ncbi:Putative von Willebrand factor, vWF type A domain protein STM2315 [hydrothermal vent metagenome]|uniref:von Willebrand factor, vWF type A domain protein STM2315 n=1 Tax=hydrothermal vent metagenome TaxID=652676 RepID=A0A3B0TZZ5_9ZZZZ
MTVPDLRKLADIKPAENQAARARAIRAGLTAFDAETQKKSTPPQGSSLWRRLTAIFNLNSRRWTMDRRIAFGVLAAGVLLVPLTAQLMNTTSFSPPQISVGRQAALEDRLQPVTPPPRAELSADPKADAVLPQQEVVADEPAPVPMATVRTTKPAAVLALKRNAPASVPVAKMRTLAAPPASRNFMETKRLVAPGIGALLPRSPYAGQADDEQFEAFTTNPVTAVADQPVSTFSIDVDTASYAMVRRTLEAGRLPPPDMVRIEEMINYFDYDYPAPQTLDRPFRASVAIYPTPWNPETQLLHIGIKGHSMTPAARPRSNLVLLIDVSGSMRARDKLPLLKSAFRLLLGQLQDDDTVAIVTYAGGVGTALEPTRVKDRSKILSALDKLGAGGSTAGAAGIRAAYDLARANFDPKGVNRVILATDGDFNVGISDPEALKTYIAKERRSGVMLSVLGFGQGNLNDRLMQTLAQNGNGTAAYIDTLREAHKVLVDEASATLYPIAKDVKIQVEFNPATVAEYRLIGYETRALERSDFNNDRIDAGDIGAGHEVTAIYEITPRGSGAQLIDDLRYGAGAEKKADASGEYAFLKIRYKAPKASTSQLITRPIGPEDMVADFSRLSDDMRFAASVAAFGQKLRGVPHLRDFGTAEIAKIAAAARGPDVYGYRGEFLALVRLAGALDPETAPASADKKE